MLTPVPLAIILLVLLNDAARADRLIEQLGSQVFAERQEATRALLRLGLPALEPLRTAAKTSDDLEIRRRAEGLVNAIEKEAIIERIRGIRQSKLSPEEKAQQLKPLFHEGMPGAVAQVLLGEPSTTVNISGQVTDYYPECGLSIYYDSEFKI